MLVGIENSDLLRGWHFIRSDGSARLSECRGREPVGPLLGEAAGVREYHADLGVADLEAGEGGAYAQKRGQSPGRVAQSS